jgi:HJR/Mrr/RecB family endonuclease
MLTRSVVAGKRRRKRSGTEYWPTLLLLIFFVFAFVSQYRAAVASVVLCMVAGVGLFYWQRRKRNYQRWANLTEIRVLTPQQFESHVADFYRFQGWSVCLTPQVGDQGVDVIAERAGHRMAIQCKLYSNNVSNDAVQQVLAGKSYYKCNSAAVFASSGFTASAIELAKRSKVQLVTGPQYAELMRLLVKRRAKQASNATPITENVTA